MTPANTNTPTPCNPLYIGANWLGVHKVRFGNEIARFWTKEEAEAAIKWHGQRMGHQ